MSATSAQISAQIIAQLRMLDPSVSAEIGTPERKIIDSVSQGLSDAQIDLDGLSAALDIDSKYGAALDRFFAIFGFARQGATYAKGYVNLGRLSASNLDITIPMGNRVRAYVDNGSSGVTSVDFATLFDAILPAGQTSVLVPIQALVTGAIGNVAAFDITEIVGTTLNGITEVFNDASTTGGADQEDDDQFKVRFKNTVFRNLAGTEDQYLALAIATTYSTKANVVGPQSVYREYIQVPSTDDSIGGNGDTGEYSTTLSTIPYAKEIWTNVPPFISNGTDVGSYFYRQGVDFDFNLIASQKNRGDAYRVYQDNPDDEIDPTSDEADERPSVTFTNVYTGSNTLIDSIRPDDIVLLEYRYLSKASRNSLVNNVTNAVDVFVDGGNLVSASTVISRPNSISTFVDNPTSLYHIENYRRIGQPERRPDTGNVLVPLYWQPTYDVPNVLIVSDVSYYKDIHYWAVEDISNIGGTIRSRSGIEFSTKERGQREGDSGTIEEFTGPIIIDGTEDTDGVAAVEIDNYVYDKNIADLQTSLESSKQVTTDVLAHKARSRYLKCDFAIMYTNGIPDSSTNNQISSAIDSYLKSLFFGSAVQLSDIIQVAHSLSGVDNIRWSSDLPDRPDEARMYQTDVNGVPLCNVTLDTYTRGRDSVPVPDPEGTPIPSRIAVQNLFISGEPKSGTFVISYGTDNLHTATIDVSQNGSTIVNALNTFSSTLPSGSQFTAAVIARTNEGSDVSQRVFSLTFSTAGPQDSLFILSTDLHGGPYIIENDFFINDNEIAALPDSVYAPLTGVPDSAPGIIARPRAQGTWIKG